MVEICRSNGLEVVFVVVGGGLGASQIWYGRLWYSLHKSRGRFWEIVVGVLGKELGLRRLNVIFNYGFIFSF